jgi:serine/threonine-protein kinase RsbW
VFDASDRRAYEQELLRARQRAERLQRHNALLYERERAVTLGLQRAMLPQGLLEDPRCTIAAHYAAAVDTLEVGGDWYDAFCVAPDRIGLVVGDVVGKGLDAAATMGQLRSAVRAHGVSGLSPQAVLEHLDDFVGQTENAEAATVALAEVDLSSGEIRLACAGHPPPIVVPPDGDPTLIWEGRSGPLGFRASAKRSEGRWRIEPMSRILLYTDGAVEQRDGDIDIGIERLMSSFARRRDEPIEGVVASLSAELIAEQQGADDVCMLAFAFDGVPPEHGPRA